jgi:ribosome biogenesis GTPase
VLAANLDVVFIVSSLNEDLNLRRLERYLTLAWESGATPVILLTKADLHPDPDAAAAEVGTIAYGVPVHPLSARTGAGVAAVREHLLPGVTAALLGSSGVGKSTLVNTLTGEELLATQAIRDDGSGRHTTTRRELVVLPGGGLVIDTPGLRELQLWEADEGLEEAFEDVAELAAQCRFSDCAHETEPGCAIQAALEDGRLTHERWESYVKLQRELEHLERRLDKRAQAEEKRRWRAVNVEMRRRQQAKGGAQAGRPSTAHGDATFGAPRVVVVVNAQSAAASSESKPSGSLASEPSTVFESATVSGRAVPSTSEYVCPPMVAAVIAPS